jgi:hypothetical protein
MLLTTRASSIDAVHCCGLGLLYVRGLDDTDYVHLTRNLVCRSLLLERVRACIVVENVQGVKSSPDEIGNTPTETILDDTIVAAARENKPQSDLSFINLFPVSHSNSR